MNTMDNAQRIEALSVTALNEYIKTLLDTRRTALLMCEERLGTVYSMRLKNARSRFGAAVASLDAMNPLSVLARGYAAVHSGDGRRIIGGVDGLCVGDEIKLTMRDGEVAATVDGIMRKNNG